MYQGVALLFLTGILQGTTGKALQETRGNSLWQPSDGRTRSEWLQCRGLPCEEWNRTASAMTSLRRQLTFIEERSEEVSSYEASSQEELSDHDLFGGDILFTPAQAEQLLRQTHVQPSRIPRAVTSDTNRRWSLPIFYKFDGDHDDKEMKVIRAAIGQWEKHTCLRFFEVNKSAPIRKSHLLFTRALKACASFVGQLELPIGDPQMINLGKHCFGQPGTAIHEIGHALGLWHQHQRPSRDDYITIHGGAIASWAQTNFIRVPEEVVSEFGLPYDYNSVMHYSGMVGTNSGSMTISTNDQKFQSNIGQRQGLSDLDAKTINLAYCQDECKSGDEELKQPCLRGGYQNPNRCQTCLCPDGMGGNFCGEAAPPAGADCGGEIFLSKGESVQITSPGYGKRGSYADYTECNWLLQGAEGSKLQLEFSESFNLYQSTNSQLCHHWVEVRTEKDFSNPGPRMCGGVRPRDVFRSEGSEILVTFRSAAKTPVGFASFDGFKLWATAATPDVIEEIREPPSGPEAPNNEPDVEWSEWSRCSKQCQCGGCGVRSRHALCGGQRCLGELAEVQQEHCSRVCHSGDQKLIFVGEFLLSACSECCQGFKRHEDLCIPDEE